MQNNPVTLSLVQRIPTGRTVRVEIQLIEVARCEFHYVLSHDCNFGTQHSDRYYWVWNAASDAAFRNVIRNMGLMASTPDVQFDWYDSAIACEFIRMAAQPIDIEMYIGRPEPWTKFSL